MNWIWPALGLGAVGVYFVLRGKSGSAKGATDGTTWQLVKDAAPRVPAANGSTIPIWYRNAPVDPSERWAALAKQHGQEPKGFLACIVVVVVQKKSDPSKKQALSVEVVSTEAAKDGGLTGRVVPDVLGVPMAQLVPPALLGDETDWPPAIGTEIAFTPSDVVAFVQP